MSFIVAIDGPAGTGKGTITNLISKELGLVNIDTGATYRCVALYAIKNNIKLEETQKIINSLKNIHISIEKENGEQKVFLNNEEVTKEIRSKEVTKIVSQVSSIKEVRYKMVEVERSLAQGKDVIMEGRDITTVVFPNANVKIYMDADEKIRAQRRHKEMQEKGIQITYEEVLKNIQIRDKNDKEKEVGALKIAKDAIYLDTTELSIEEVKNKILNIIKESRLGTVPNRKQDREE